VVLRRRFKCCLYGQHQRSFRQWVPFLYGQHQHSFEQWVPLPLLSSLFLSLFWKQDGNGGVREAVDASVPSTCPSTPMWLSPCGRTRPSCFSLALSCEAACREAGCSSRPHLSPRADPRCKNACLQLALLGGLLLLHAPGDTPVLQSIHLLLPAQTTSLGVGTLFCFFRKVRPCF